jgi:hypothetical protein
MIKNISLLLLTLISSNTACAVQADPLSEEEVTKAISHISNGGALPMYVSKVDPLDICNGYGPYTYNSSLRVYSQFTEKDIRDSVSKSVSHFLACKKKMI